MLNFEHTLRYAVLGTGLFLALAATPLCAAKDEPYDQAIAQLKNKDPQVRRQGAEALGRIRNPASADALKKLLTDKTPIVRSQAIEALGLMRLMSVSSDVANMLGSDPDPGVRQMSAIALGYIADPHTVPALMRGLKDSHDGVRFASVNSLGILRNDSAAMALAQELRSPDARMRGSVAYALGNIASRSSVPGLIDSVKVSLATSPAANEGYLMDAAVGASSIRSLGMIGDASAAPAIKKYLNHKDKKVRVNTAQALYRLGDHSGLPTARLFVKDSDSYNRRVAAELLGDIGDSSDLGALKKLKGDPDQSVDQSAKTSIEKIESRSPKAKAAAAAKSAPAPAKKAAAPSAPAKK